MSKECPVYELFIVQNTVVFATDYEKSVIGLRQDVMRLVPKGYALFLPESLLEEIPYQDPSSEKQEKTVKKVSKNLAKDDKASMDAMGAAEESINIMEQQEAYYKYEAEKETKDRGNFQGLPRREGGHRQCEVPSIFHQQLHQRDQQPPEAAPDMHRGQVRQKELPPDSGFNQHYRPQYSNARQQPDYQEQPFAYRSQYYNNQPRVDAGEGEVDYNLGIGSLIQIPTSDSVQYGIIKWVGLVPNASGRVAGIELVIIISCLLIMPCIHQQKHITMQDEVMEGGSNGTFHGTGQKLFDCPPGKGLYYPLSSLKQDQRYAVTDGQNRKDT